MLNPAGDYRVELPRGGGAARGFVGKPDARTFGPPRGGVAQVGPLLNEPSAGATANCVQRGGWLDPRAVCHALLDHPLITVQEDCGPLTLERTDSGRWQALRVSQMSALPIVYRIRTHHQSSGV